MNDKRMVAIISGYNAWIAIHKRGGQRARDTQTTKVFNFASVIDCQFIYIGEVHNTTLTIKKYKYIKNKLIKNI